jgi:hypothetical protein
VNCEKSHLLLKEVRFLEKRPKKFAKEPASGKISGLFFAIPVIGNGKRDHTKQIRRMWSASRERGCGLCI